MVPGVGTERNQIRCFRAGSPATGAHLVDVPALASQPNVTERFVRRLLAERRVPFIKIGEFVRFDPVAFERWPDGPDTLGGAAAIDHLADLAPDHNPDVDDVTLVGHSAGGHRALWANREAEAAVNSRLVIGRAAVTYLVPLGDTEVIHASKA